MKQRKRPLFQNEETYTEEHRKVWRILFERQWKWLKDVAVSNYIHALEEIGFNPSEIPLIEKVNQILESRTGWQLVIVPQIVGQHEFFGLLSEKKFPVTVWLREMEELDYLEEPDMFHDVFGHVPLLLDPGYGAFFQAMGRIALAHRMEETVVRALGNIYWFTIEFGLISENGQTRIYGAGIFSSIKETCFSLSKKALHRPFSIPEMINQPYRTDCIQPVYFITPSFEYLKNSIPEIEEYIENHVLNIRVF